MIIEIGFPYHLVLWIRFLNIQIFLIAFTIILIGLSQITEPE